MSEDINLNSARKLEVDLKNTFELALGKTKPALLNGVVVDGVYKPISGIKTDFSRFGGAEKSICGVNFTA